MADLKISQLTDGGASQATDEYVIARSGANYRIDGASIAAAATSVGTLSSLTVSGDLTVDTSTLKVDSANNRVGILTASPAYALDLASGIARFDSSGGDGLRVYGGSGTNQWDVYCNSTNLRISDNTGGGSLVVDTGATIAGNLAVDTNTLYVDAANNRVGIGTASPATTLSIDNTRSDTPGSGFLTYTNAAVTSGRRGVRVDTSNGLWVDYYNGSSWSGQLAIDASGNLGLGVTPSAWAGQAASYYVAQAGNAAFYGVSTNIARMSVNAFVNSAGENRYISNGYATRHDQQDGAFTWRTAPSGTAGNNITFTQAMTLDASGNLGVGTASPTISAAATGIDIYDATDVQFRLHTGVSGTGLSDGFVLSMASDSTVYLYGYENAPMIFATNNAERARITAGGYFKASNDGTYNGSTASYHEWRQSTNDLTAVISNTGTGAVEGILLKYTASTPNNTGSPFIFCSDATATRAAIRSNGGLANYQSNNVDLSDARTKTDITPAASMWDKVAALEIVTYKYNDQTHDDVNVGVIAQQVETVEPVWVDTDGWDKETPEGEEPLKTVYTKDITFAAIKALQEAMARIEVLEAHSAALEARLEALEA